MAGRVARPETSHPMTWPSGLTVHKSGVPSPLMSAARSVVIGPGRQFDETWYGEKDAVAFASSTVKSRHRYRSRVAEW